MNKKTLKNIWIVTYGFFTVYLILSTVTYFGVTAYEGLSNVKNLSVEGGWLYLNYLATGIVLIGGPIKSCISKGVNRVKAEKKKGWKVAEVRGNTDKVKKGKIKEA